MSQVINTNVMSLNSQRNLGKSSGMLAESLARLSSGLRINSAKDDAAGLAISERFTTQIRGMNQAVRNANDGISLAQTAEGALQEVANNLQRIRELGVQARNATNSASDREALDAEVQQRIAEIQRVASQTEFNGLKLLDGSFNQQVFQVGANFGQTISVNSIASSTTAALGLSGGNLTNYELDGGEVTAALDAGDLTIDGIKVGEATRDAASIAGAINSAGTSVTATATNVVTSAWTDVTGSDAEHTYQLSINEESIIDLNGTFGPVELGDVVAAIAGNAAMQAAGITAEDVGGALVITAADGRNIDIVQDATGVTGGSAETGVQYGSVSLSSTAAFDVGGSGAAAAGFTAGPAAEVTTEYSAINVLDPDEADTVLRVIDAALTSVNSSRADLGAVQNRFESVVANLSTSVENLSASRSRIVDTDFAAETAALTRAQVLQQAGVAMLAQANMMPQNVLALLR